MGRTPRGHEPPSVAAVQRLCQRARSAGSPGAAARPPLVAEYRRLAQELGVEATPVGTGRDLQRAAVGLLRAAAAAEAAAAASPRARLLRARSHRPA